MSDPMVFVRRVLCRSLRQYADLGAGGYGLWTVLPYVTIVFAIVLAVTGIGMYKMSDEEAEAQMAELQAEATA